MDDDGEEPIVSLEVEEPAAAESEEDALARAMAEERAAQEMDA